MMEDRLELELQRQEAHDNPPALVVVEPPQSTLHLLHLAGLGAVMGQARGLLEEGAAWVEFLQVEEQLWS